jgi:formylglycine-generating enzyme required for sulfatase activity
MARPETTEFLAAVQDLRGSMADAELRAGEVGRTPLGLPLLWSGNFADVFKIHCPATGNTWALKCFTRHVPGLQERYRHIAAALEQARLPFTVDFQYLPQGIRIGEGCFPALKMRWVEGLTLAEFVEEHLERPSNLRMLLDLWVKLSVRLREAGIAHADLQHGNVLLVPATGGSLALRLVDYDGMYVPALAGTRCGEVGHPAYQHPQRLREGTYNAEVDRFSHLAIYTSIRCLMLGRRGLWQRFNNGDNVLFREADFVRPRESALFRALWKSLPDSDARALVGRVVLACGTRLEETPRLDEVVTDKKALSLTSQQQAAVNAILAPPESSPARSIPEDDVPLEWLMYSDEEAQVTGDRFHVEPAAITGARAPRVRSPYKSSIVGILVSSLLLVAIALALYQIYQKMRGPKKNEITVDLGDGVNLKMVLVGPGDFQMGSPDSDSRAGPLEKPQHQARIAKPFYLGKYPVTQEQWKAIMGALPDRIWSKDPKKPVAQVSWKDCQEFLEKLNDHNDPGAKRFRLPTETEWEYACRAESKTSYCFGDGESRLGDYAWYRANSDNDTHPVGQKKDNAWGFYDMHGNVWEWCQDELGDRHHANLPADDPAEPTKIERYVCRGGGWNSSTDQCRSAACNELNADTRDDEVGFRIAREAE